MEAVMQKINGEVELLDLDLVLDGGYDDEDLLDIGSLELEGDDDW
jgi:hypothetical protein